MFVQARHYTSGRIRRVRLVTIHSMESAEGRSTAEDVARWFASDGAPQASAHECIDADSYVGCVRDVDTAWAAPGANADGVHLELAGMAEQSTSQWEDIYSRQVLTLAARRAAFWLRKYGLPARWLTIAQLRDGKSKGLTTHADITAAKLANGDHWDPGPHFPRPLFLALVQVELDALGGAPWTRSRIAKVAAALAVPVALFVGATQVPDQRPAPVPPAVSTPAPHPSVTPKPVPPVVKPPQKPVPQRPVVLAYGSHGEAVKVLQRRLKLRVGGVYDRTTMLAVEAFQRRYGLRVDGIAGPVTLGRLGLHL